MCCCTCTAARNALGSAAAAAGLAADLARRSGTRAVSVDYRLAPEHPYPATVQDALAAYQGLLDDGVPASRIAVVGESADAAVTAAYARLDPLAARNQDATSSLLRSGADAHPVSVAEEITRILALPAGGKPFRSVVDFTDSGVEYVNSVIQQAREDFVSRMGFGQMLQVHPVPCAAERMDQLNLADSDFVARRLNGRTA